MAGKQLAHAAPPRGRSPPIRLATGQRLRFGETAIAAEFDEPRSLLLIHRDVRRIDQHRSRALAVRCAEACSSGASFLEGSRTSADYVFWIRFVRSRRSRRHATRRAAAGRPAPRRGGRARRYVDVRPRQQQRRPRGAPSIGERRNRRSRSRSPSRLGRASGRAGSRSVQPTRTASEHRPRRAGARARRLATRSCRAARTAAARTAARRSLRTAVRVERAHRVTSRKLLAVATDPVRDSEAGSKARPANTLGGSCHTITRQLVEPRYRAVGGILSSGWDWRARGSPSGGARRYARAHGGRPLRQRAPARLRGRHLRRV